MVTEDIFEYIMHGVRAVGATINYSMAEYQGDCVNIMMEGCKVGTAKSFAELRRKYPESRLYMIVTEILTAEGLALSNEV